MRSGLVWSHVLASILGGLVVAGVLLAFGVIGKQRTETVPVVSSSVAPSNAGGVGSGSSAEQIFLAASPGVVLIKTRVAHRATSPFISGAQTAGSTATGSGFLLSSQGFILTTYHEIQGADPVRPVITVVFNAQTSRRAKVVRESATDDLALLQVSLRGVSNRISPLNLGNSRSVNVGASVLAVADPYGVARTLSSGIVSAQQEQLVGAGGIGVSDALQTDIPPSPGADGGPLLDATGDVIGVNSQIEVDNGGSTYTIGFAVPIDTAKAMFPKGLAR